MRLYSLVSSSSHALQSGRQVLPTHKQFRLVEVKERERLPLMWKWHCPDSPLLVLEYHTEEQAREGLSFHVLGSEHFGFKDVWNLGVCDLEHEVVDDGVPCSWERLSKKGKIIPCEIKYVPAPVKVGAYGRIVV